MPCSVTQWRTRMPIAAILSSKPSPLSGRRTQTPMRSSRRSPRTLKSASVRMIHSSSVATKRRTSGRAALEVEHDVADPLAGPVIGELAAAARVYGPESVPRSVPPAAPRCRRCKAAGARAARPVPAPSPRAIASARASMAASAGRHRPTGRSLTRHSTGGAAGRRRKPDRQFVARVNHLVTMPW